MPSEKKPKEVKFALVCIECGTSHCCGEDPHVVNEPFIEGPWHHGEDDLAVLGEDHSCSGGKPWPSVIGSYR